MSVIITPSERLEFRRPFTRISKESITIENPSEQTIAFKIKTTAPKQYSVRPNAGLIEPNSETEVQILLQPFKEELPENYQCKDKFLVQTLTIKNLVPEEDVAAWWNQIEVTDKASIYQHKIKCAFLSEEDKSKSDTNHTAAGVHSSIAQATAAPSSIAPLQTENTVDSKLKAALDKIAALEKQLVEAKSNVKAGPQPSSHSHVTTLKNPLVAQGHPPQVLVGVAVLVFILTYFFF